MAIKVYGVPAGATASAILTAYEKCVEDFELVVLDMGTKEHKTPEYLAKHPFGQIPCLEDGDVTLFESRAIARYIADKYAGQGADLYPKAAAKRALVDQWMEVEAHWYGIPASAIAGERWYAPTFLGKPGDEAVVAENVKKLEAVLDIYEAHLTKNKFFGGDEFTLADIVHMSLTNYLEFAAPKDFAGLMEGKTHVQSWWKNVTARPSWKKYEAELMAYVAKAHPELMKQE
eukprot:TRINITY_DN901_c0_g3_i1.p1 TRINITY_DN901_c0_g3~~TRINITY_DN901_c0_g3_i1.p1  ORF type:complete len:252 (+),score=40.34 TRINITY_DN901_c0_g3_i1:64-756(+)